MHTIKAEPKPKILFLCTGNSCRSQMAEGWSRHLKGSILDIWSAGVDVKGIDPLAVKVMKEAGVDISGHSSKHINELKNIRFDYVITLCGDAGGMVGRCPVFSGGTRVVRAGFDDPPALAGKAETEEEALLHYRRVRDQIRAFVEKLPEELSGGGKDYP